MMRYKPFHFCFLMFLLFLASCTLIEETPQEKTDLEVSTIEITNAKEESTEPWQIVKQLDLEFEPDYVAFINEDIGFTTCGGENNGPSFTEDGGEDWLQPEHKLYCLTTVEIVNQQIAFMCNGD